MTIKKYINKKTMFIYISCILLCIVIYYHVYNSTNIIEQYVNTQNIDDLFSDDEKFDSNISHMVSYLNPIISFVNDANNLDKTHKNYDEYLNSLVYILNNYFQSIFIQNIEIIKKRWDKIEYVEIKYSQDDMESIVENWNNINSNLENIKNDILRAKEILTTEYSDTMAEFVDELTELFINMKNMNSSNDLDTMNMEINILRSRNIELFDEIILFDSNNTYSNNNYNDISYNIDIQNQNKIIDIISSEYEFSILNKLENEIKEYKILNRNIIRKIYLNNIK
jgi:preprotein translocase subunit SecD